MFKVFVGGISPEGEHLLTTYLNVFMPDAVIEPLKAVGIKGKMKNHAKRQDVALVIIDESLYQACVGVADDVLSLPKVHKYTDDESLNQFLISKFGRLDGVDVNESSVIPPDVLMKDEESDSDSNDVYIPKSQEIFTSPSSETVPPDSIIDGSEGIVHTVKEDSYDNLAVTEEDVTANEKDSDIIADLQDKLAKSEMLVHNLTLQLEDKSSNSDDDIKAFVGRIHELEQQLEEKDRQIASSGENNYVQLGKVARAEQIINEFDELKAKLKTANEDKSQLEYDKNNLTSQVELLHTKIEELKNQVAEIEVLKETVRGRDDEIKSLSEELNSSRSDLDNKESEITELTSKISELESSSDDKSKEIDSLRDNISAKEKEISDLHLEITNKQNELDAKQAELSSKESELSTALETISEQKTEIEQKINELSEKDKEVDDAIKLSTDSDSIISELQTQINELSSKISELESCVSDKDSEISELKLKVSDSEKVSSDFEEKIKSTENEVTNLRLQLADSENENKELKEKLESAERNISEFKSQLDASRNSESELREQLSNSNNELENSKSVSLELDEKCKEIDDLNAKISELQSSIDSKDSEIRRLKDENSIATSNSEAQIQAVDKVIAEKNELEDKLVEVETKKIELESKISTLQSQLDTANNSIVDKDTNILELKAKRDELELQIEQLQNDVIASKADSESISRLENDLLEERKKSAKLTSEVEVLRKTDDSSKTSELRIEIARLKNELSSVKDTSASAEELEICKKELQESRERCSNLEMDIIERDDVIKELETGVFGRMAGVALSKAAFDINLPSLVNIPQNFYCVAGGSNESNLALYQLLKKSCVQDASKRILILDLATDSHIDREFGIQQATSPVAWLEGSSSFKNFIAGTRYSNVRVLTTALSYLNDLSLLNVDWQKRMNDLSSFNADIVIINVGCLNNVVTKILFNMFSHAMTSYVITKATPINLRSVILNMTGFREVSHYVTVTCVGFDERASRNMYQRLVAKYKAQILNDSEVLKL